MVKRSNNDSKGSLANLFSNFIAIINVIIVTDMILVLICVKAIVCCFVDSAPLNTSGKVSLLALLFLSLLYIEVIYILVF